jgi:hypothetical protein
MRKRRPRAPLEGELEIDWERWADGRAHRLTRKRDFPDVEPALVRAHAEVAAKRMGRGVMTAKDRMIADKYLWVQFSDHRIGFGDPCPCGSRRLLRVHANFLRCPECKALLMVFEDDDTEEAREGRMVRQLRKLSDVHLERRERAGDRELYRGYGRQGDTPVLVWAEFRLKPKEERLREEDVFDRVVSVRTVAFTELMELFNAHEHDVTSLWNGREPDWDLVWLQPAEPDSGGEADELLD